MNTPNRIEHQLTDKGYVPVYTTAVVDQPWDSYSKTDHEVWATLFKRQRELLPGRASTEFLQTQDEMGMGEHGIPKFSDLNIQLKAKTGWEIIAVEGLLPVGHQTVGTRLDVSHTAATPVGMRVVAHAEVIKVDGRKLTFRLWAEDAVERIGEGTHERIIVNVERFDIRTQAKVASAAIKK